VNLPKRAGDPEVKQGEEMAAAKDVDREGSESSASQIGPIRESNPN